MKLTKILFLLLITLPLFTSCGSDDDDDGGAAVQERQEDTGKDLFSTWTRSDGFFLDLRTGAFSTPFEMSFFFEGGEICNCTGLLLGTQSSGRTNLADCSYGGGGAGDPGCSTLNGTGRYTKTDDTLRICDPECGTYQ